MIRYIRNIFLPSYNSNGNKKKEKQETLEFQMWQNVKKKIKEEETETWRLLIIVWFLFSQSSFCLDSPCLFTSLVINNYPIFYSSLLKYF